MGIKTKKGFTLVEIMIVVAIIALLSVGATMAYRGITLNSRRAVLVADATKLAAALNGYNASVQATAKIPTDANVPTLKTDTFFSEAVIQEFIAFAIGASTTLEFYPKPTGNTMALAATADTIHIQFKTPVSLLVAAQEQNLIFESWHHIARALSFIDYNVNGQTFIVNEAHIRHAESRGLQRRTANGASPAFVNYP
ncbi:MAG: prepilin-type N-terminal cleavage/methylation domain-containing protein [Defluviitaleaceae bacterium]|nr:prepilin-type N-terminal cleavage/methylation domain-containing protein [Defluviitaleaceae bacterium]